LLNNSGVIAFRNLVIIARKECIEENFIIKRVNSGLLLAFLFFEEVGEYAVLYSSQNENAHLISSEHFTIV